jgi:hypothetical protein
MILMGVLLLYMGISVIRQVGLSQQRKEDRDQLQQDLVLAQEKTAALEEELDYVQSSEAVEAYGRVNNLGRPGEVPVIPSDLPSDADADDQATAEQERRAGSTRAAWWEFFFGRR